MAQGPVSNRPETTRTAASPRRIRSPPVRRSWRARLRRGAQARDGSRTRKALARRRRLARERRVRFAPCPSRAGPGRRRCAPKGPPAGTRGPDTRFEPALSPPGVARSSALELDLLGEAFAGLQMNLLTVGKHVLAVVLEVDLNHLLVGGEAGQRTQLGERDRIAIPLVQRPFYVHLVLGHLPSRWRIVAFPKIIAYLAFVVDNAPIAFCASLY